MSVTTPGIVVPVTSVEEARQVIDAGANELYCGFLPAAWQKRYGDSDLLTRRQGRDSHFNSLQALRELVRLARGEGCPVTLTLNARYSEEQQVSALGLAQTWEDLGGKSVMVADLGILLALQTRRSSLRRHLSLLAGVYNRWSAQFFSGFGVSRIVFPREVSIGEMKHIVRSTSGIEFEALVMFQKCAFIDGLCSFHHGTRLPSGTPSSFCYRRVRGEGTPETVTIDPQYEGHACEIPWKSSLGPVRLSCAATAFTPTCAACQLRELSAAGVGYFKLAGRGFPTELLVEGTRLIRDAWRIHASGKRREDHVISAIRARYAHTFGIECSSCQCYYGSGC